MVLGGHISTSLVAIGAPFFYFLGSSNWVRIDPPKTEIFGFGGVGPPPPQNFFWGVGGGVPIFTQSLLVRVPHSPALLWPSGPRVCDLTPLFGQNAVVDCCTFPTSSWPAPQNKFWGGGRQAGKCLNGRFSRSDPPLAPRSTLRIGLGARGGSLPERFLGQKLKKPPTSSSTGNRFGH